MSDQEFHPADLLVDIESYLGAATRLTNALHI
jgi:hypothetical protein